MTVKLKDVIQTFSLKDAKQIGAKQLFYGFSNTYGTYVYISYRTIIGVKASAQWYITDEYFSRTTTTHKREVVNRENCICNVTEGFFKSTLEGLRQSKLLR